MKQEYFERKDKELFCEGVSVKAAAEKFGTPLYLYSASHIKERYNNFEEALKGYPHEICYAVKACSNIHILELFAKAGSGFDIVSGCELRRVIDAGGDPRKCVYAGVGKSAEEIKLAVENEILYFGVESVPELERINAIAGKLGKVARVALRANPDVDAHTHDYITTGKSENKFGLTFSQTEEILKNFPKKYPNLEAAGLQIHIGSQITETEPYRTAVLKAAEFVKKLRAQGTELKYFDIGGGLGIVYKDEEPATPAELIKEILPPISELGMTFVCEMGRYMVGNSSVLVTKVEYVKENPDKTFVIVDAAMNDLIRPALYEAYHDIVPVEEKDGTFVCDVVGPVCESGDFFRKDCRLAKVGEGDLLAICSAGAYGFTMSSNYNSRNRAAEVLVEGDEMTLIRKRETYEDQVRNEKTCR
ncbi:diaminopimelate decarboxylase [bacterium]|nr:diaminopimelate decarboxylase [bacterium]